MYYPRHVDSMLILYFSPQKSNILLILLLLLLKPKWIVFIWVVSSISSKFAYLLNHNLFSFCKTYISMKDLLLIFCWGFTFFNVKEYCLT